MVPITHEHVPLQPPDIDAVELADLPTLQRLQPLEILHLVRAAMSADRGAAVAHLPHAP
jgi:hypothetical protein